MDVNTLSGKFDEALQTWETRSGISCMFVNLKDGYGIKAFHKEATRDHSYKLQKIASFHGLGPKCNTVFDMPNQKTYKWAFLTQVADKFNPGPEWHHVSSKESKYHQTWLDLVAIGIVVYDAHGNNMGMIDGKPVCIDFGEPGQGVEYFGKRRTLCLKPDSGQHYRDERKYIHSLVVH